MNAPVNCMCLHPNQATLIVGDQSGTIHVWELTTDHNEQLVRMDVVIRKKIMFHILRLIPHCDVKNDVIHEAYDVIYDGMSE